MIQREINQTDLRVLALMRLALADTDDDASTALDGDTQALFFGMDDDDWKAVYKQAAEQGVMALCWDGAQRLPNAQKPTRPVKLLWGLEVQRYEERYAYFVRTLAQLSRFYAEHDILTVQLKGVGFSTYYPVPAHREGGDIDIYTCAADPELRLNEEENRKANRRADELMSEQGVEVDTTTSYKHSHFNYQHLSIENHKTFINAEHYAMAKRLNKVLHRLMKPERIELSCGPAAPDEHYTVHIAPAAFNALFIPFHATQHYGSGLALHHLADWACVMRRPDFQLPPEALAEQGFMRAVTILTLLCKRCLGIEPGGPLPLLIEPNTKEMAHKMLLEIMHPAFAREIPEMGPLGVLCFKTRRFLYRGDLGDAFLGSSKTRRIWDSIVIHLRHPSTIFGRGR